MSATAPRSWAVVPRLAWRDGAAMPGNRDIAEETAIAFTFQRETYAVMMASPGDLDDFAVGFCLNEGIVDHARDIQGIDVVPVENGIELRLDLPPALQERVRQRRRRIAGPTGCGMCGMDSLAQALFPPPPVRENLILSASDILAGMRSLTARQALGRATRATHAAGWWEQAKGLVALREDVGRHNALDKLAGSLARAPRAPGMVLLTSRVSVEMVQKTARIGACVLAAASAPTGLALRMAAAAGITLVGIVREDGCEVFTHPGRIVEAAGAG